MLISILELDNRWRNSNELMSLLPLLEYSYPEVLNEIDTFKSISTEILIQLIDFSFRFSSEYWMLCSLLWIENGFPINQNIYENIIGISKDKRYSQKIRHKAFAQAIKWQRENSI